MTRVARDIARVESGVPVSHAVVDDAGARLSLADRVWALRDRLLARPSFHRWVARFPLTRGFARRKEKALFGIIAGFVFTQVLTAGVRLGLFDALKAGPLDADAIARRIGLPRESTLRLLDAAVSIELVSRRSGERYGLGDLGAAVATTPAFATIVEHNAIFYGDVADPVALLKGERCDTTLSRFWAYAHSADPAELSPQAVDAYTRFMAASQALIADDVIDAYPFARHRRVLDVGGGDGTFLAALGARVPTLELVVFDLPPVAATAAARLSAAGLGARSTTVGGSFLTDPLPPGADLVTLNRVLLDHDDATVLGILGRARDALPAGGRLLVAETMSGVPAGDAYFGFYLMAMGRGRARSFEQLKTLLEQAGFTAVRRIPTYRATLTSLLGAQKPS